MNPYPNPANGITCIPVSAKGETNANVYLSDVVGRKLMDIHTGNLPAGTTNYFINAANLPPGMYLITVETPRAKTTVKLMVR